MPLRYYWICFILVLTLTVAISWIRQTRTRKEFFITMAAVTAGLVAMGLLLFGLATLLESLGIAESGFIF